METKPTSPVRKRTSFTWAEWLIYGALALWVLVLVPLSIWGWPTLFRWAKHPAMSAWVQTGGVLIGIGVAIWAPWWQREHAQRDARLGASSLAAYVLATLRLARNEQVWSRRDPAEGAKLHLQVAHRLWATVRLDALPFNSIPAFVAMIALTDEAIGMCDRHSPPGEAYAIQLAAQWESLCTQAEGCVDRIYRRHNAT